MEILYRYCTHAAPPILRLEAATVIPKSFFLLILINTISVIFCCDNYKLNPLVFWSTGAVKAIGLL